MNVNVLIPHTVYQTDSYTFIFAYHLGLLRIYISTVIKSTYIFSFRGSAYRGTGHKGLRRHTKDFTKIPGRQAKETVTICMASCFNRIIGPTVHTRV